MQSADEDAAGIPGTRIADSGFDVTLTDQFAVADGDGATGPHTIWIARQRRIRILDIDMGTQHREYSAAEGAESALPGGDGKGRDPSSSGKLGS